MKVVNTHEAKTHLSRLLDEASAGEEIVIARAGNPVARLVRYEAAKKPRKLGVLKGKIVESTGCCLPKQARKALPLSHQTGFASDICRC